uniref:MADS-box domain-containing protein n=1 Tax=Kalanchoe fedtschenkoi TaxID=63787 RepID=A0A7N0T5K1_KALFE
MATPIESVAAVRSIFKEKVEQIWRDLDELKVLCGADACVIIYGPDNVPQVWPPAGMDFRRVVAKFLGVPPEAAGTSRLVAKIRERFLKANILKNRAKLETLQMENRHQKLAKVIVDGMNGQADLSSLTAEDLTDVLDLIADQMRKIDERMDYLKEDHPAADGGSNAAEQQAEASLQTDDTNNNDEA